MNDTKKPQPPKPANYMSPEEFFDLIMKRINDENRLYQMEKEVKHLHERIDCLCADLMRFGDYIKGRYEQ